MSATFTIRKALKSDSHAILALIHELAHYEKAPHEVVNNAAAIENHGFGATPLFEAWVAEMNGNIVGFALCYVRYSTWKGPVLYLEDLYVQEIHRRDGIGTELFNACRQYGIDKGYSRMVWQVLEWNEPAIRFYSKYGASFDGEWVNCSIPLI